MESGSHSTQPNTPRKASGKQAGQAASHGKSKPRRNPKAGVQQPAPEWQDAGPINSVEGDFDGHGHFVPTESVVQSIEPANGDAAKPPKKKKNKAKKPKDPKDQKTVQQKPVSPPANGVFNVSPAKLAYAGPTFHASPAPSALPLPKFFSQSVPNTSSGPSLQSRLDAEGDTGDSVESASSSEDNESSEAPEPDPRPFAHLQSAGRESSPLDFFFNADKAEKAKKQEAQAPPAPQPPVQSVSQQAPQHWASIYGARHNRSVSSGSPINFMTPASPNALPVTELDASQPTEKSSPSPANRALGSRSGMATNVPQTAPAKSALLSAHYQAFPGVFEADPNFRLHGHRLPRSADSTPQPLQNNNENVQPPLHYGNRNLNHLFQAARNESPPSRLRHEAQAPLDNRQIWHQEHAKKLNHRRPPPYPPHHNPVELDGSQARPVRILKRGESAPSVPAPSLSHAASSPANLQTVANNPVTSPPPSDLQSMELNLKRMLNLTVLDSQNVR